MEKNAMYHTPTEKKLVNTLFDIDGIVYVNIMAKRDVRLNIERIEQILSQKGITDNSNITKELCDMLDDLKFVDQTLNTCYNLINTVVRNGVVEIQSSAQKNNSFLISHSRI